MDRSWRLFYTTSCHFWGQGKGTHFQGKTAPASQENMEGELTGTVTSSAERIFACEITLSLLDFHY